MEYNPLNTLSYAGGAALNLSNSMHDVNGKLLFYVVNENISDGFIYDRDGNTIDILKSEIPTNNLRDWADEISIVPVPGSCTKYYLITGVIQLDDFGFYNNYPVYAILDMALQNINFPGDPTKKGALIYNTPTKNVFDLTIPSIPFAYWSNVAFQQDRFGIAVTQYRPLPYDNHFLFVSGTDGIYRYIIDGTGISYDNSSVTNPYIPDFLANNIKYSEMEVVKLLFECP